jgi:hypothetical protein
MQRERSRRFESWNRYVSCLLSGSSSHKPRDRSIMVVSKVNAHSGFVLVWSLRSSQMARRDLALRMNYIRTDLAISCRKEVAHSVVLVNTPQKVTWPHIHPTKSVSTAAEECR